MKFILMKPLFLYCLLVCASVSANELNTSNETKKDQQHETKQDHKQDHKQDSKQANITTKKTRQVMLTGEVQARDSQSIFMPSSNSSPANIRFFVPEGAKVKKGDLILRIDGGEQNIEQREMELIRNREQSLKELADLEVKKIEAERQVITVQAQLVKAKIGAALPKAFNAPLDYDRYQGEKNKAEYDLVVRQQSLLQAQEMIKRRQQDAQLAERKTQLAIDFAKETLKKMEVRAEKDGQVVHNYSPWTGARFEQGSLANTGAEVGKVQGALDFYIQAWVLEVDRPFLKEEQILNVYFDALPNSSIQGKIKRISGAPESKIVWGSGRYFKAEVSLIGSEKYNLYSGMSARLELSNNSSPLNVKQVVDTSNAPAASSQKTKEISNKSKADVALQELSLDGEVFSRLETTIAPPKIPEVWEYTLRMLAPEGSMVKIGDPVVIFENNDLKQKIDTQVSAIKEKQRQFEKMKIEHAEAARNAELMVSEAKSLLAKAESKTTQPKEAVKRIDYEKAHIEKEMQQHIYRLAQEQRDAQKKLREAEFKNLKAELAMLQSKVDVLQKGQVAMTVKADRAGTVLHLKGFDDEKITAGSKVWMGISVAKVADPEKMYIVAKVPEAQSNRIQLAQLAQVTVNGSSTALNAKVSALGSVFHGKSESQPSIVRDVELEFDGLPKNIKPGSAVQVKFKESKQTISLQTSPQKKLAKTKNGVAA